MSAFQAAKAVVLQLFDDLDLNRGPGSTDYLRYRVAENYRWRGVHPFAESGGIDHFQNEFWGPLNRSFSGLQRRKYVFLAGENAETDDRAIWVCCMGVYMGLFDAPWLGIPPTRKLMLLPFAEFHRVEDERIAETTAFLDIPSVIRQAGISILPEQTASAIVAPAPLTQDGLLYDAQPAETGRTTRFLVQGMISDLVKSDLHSPAGELESAWHDDMSWYGPDGIGATHTLARYEEQHQKPFANGLTDFEFDGNECLVAESGYCGLFCWSGFRMRPIGGFLGMPASPTAAEMRVVDVYRRQDDKLAENWIFIDILHFLDQQGLDLLGRMRQIHKK